MRTKVAGLVLMVACLAVTGASLAAQKAPDLTGTWVGVTTVPDVGEDTVTLELKREGDTYAGRCTDAAGVIVVPEIKNVVLNDGRLMFDIGVSNGTNTFPVHVAVKVAGDTMTGVWSTDGGDSAEIKLTRKAR
jgi:hypothetical protein